jgi:hypothetical protein
LNLFLRFAASNYSNASSSSGAGIPTIVTGIHEEFLNKTEFYPMADVDAITEVFLCDAS